MEKLPGPVALDGAITPAVRLFLLASTEPRESATPTAEALRARAARPAVVVLANGDDPAADAQAAADPGVRVVHKPFLPTGRVAAAQQLVGQRKPPA